MDNIFIFVAVGIFLVNIILQIIKAKNKLSGVEINKDFFQGKQQALIPDNLARAIQKKELDKMYNLFFEDKSIDVNKIYNTGETPLILAVKSGDSSIVKILLDKGAYVNVKDKQGNSPLSLAVKLGHKDVEAFLQGALKRRQRLLDQE